MASACGTVSFGAAARPLRMNLDIARCGSPQREEAQNRVAGGLQAHDSLEGHPTKAQDRVFVRRGCSRRHLERNL